MPCDKRTTHIALSNRLGATPPSQNKIMRKVSLNLEAN